MFIISITLYYQLVKKDDSYKFVNATLNCKRINISKILLFSSRIGNSSIDTNQDILTRSLVANDIPTDLIFNVVPLSASMLTANASASDLSAQTFTNVKQTPNSGLTVINRR